MPPHRFCHFGSELQWHMHSVSIPHPAPAPTDQALPSHVPVLIAGGGPVGLSLAALLARHGVASLVVEADDGYCGGSRAICMSRRSQEILGWVGADQPLVAKGLSWVGGRSHWRNTEVLHFEMPSEPTQRYAPMVNIQQYYVEEYAHQAAQAFGGACQVAWSARVTAVQQDAQGVRVEVQGPDGARHTVRAQYLVACDGGRSTVREQLGLQLQGTQYDGKYVIVDIRQDTRRPVERLAWFDPPSNPGSTILMHRQPDNVWRIDYQIRDDEDPVEAVKPGNVLPRVQSHLQMIGEDAPWEPLWISIYNAKCLTLAQLPPRPRAVCRRRRAPGADLWRARPQFGPGRRRQPGLEARARAAGQLARQPARLLFGRARACHARKHCLWRQEHRIHGAAGLRLQAHARGRAAPGRERRQGAPAHQPAPVHAHRLRGFTAQCAAAGRHERPRRRLLFRACRQAADQLPQVLGASALARPRSCP
jgi:2-polyprenyl-6-methoxyphenol hydroxylase-like FAD-dependent oxidoreductase